MVKAPKRGQGVLLPLLHRAEALDAAVANPLPPTPSGDDATRVGATARPAWITRLRLRNWRNLDRLDVGLTPRTVVVGPNGSGKSNLLAALRLLAELAGFAEGLRRALVRTEGVGRPLRCASARAGSPVSVGVDVRLGDETWSYDLSFLPRFANFGGRAKDRDEPLVISECVRVDGHVRLQRPDAGDLAEPHRLRGVALGQTWGHESLRPLREFFASMQLLRLESGALREGYGRSRFCDRTGSGLPADVGLMQREARALLLDRIVAHLRCVEPRLRRLLHGGVGGSPFLVVSGVSPGKDLPTTSETLGEGALRLLAMLWYVSAASPGAGPVLIDQPETSLHTSVIRALPNMLSTVNEENPPQLVLASSAHDLVDDPLVAPADVLVLRSTGAISEAIELRDDARAMAALAAGTSLKAVVDHIVGAPVDLARPPGGKRDA